MSLIHVGEIHKLVMVEYFVRSKLQSARADLECVEGILRDHKDDSLYSVRLSSEDGETVFRMLEQAREAINKVIGSKTPPTPGKDGAGSRAGRGAKER